MSFFATTEFLIVCLIMAAAIVAYLCMPSGRGAAREYTVAGVLDTGDLLPGGPAIGVQCLEDGTVVLTRTGLVGMTDGGAVSIAVTIIGFDITVEERLTYPRSPGWPVDRATFMLDHIGREHYHLRYNSAQTSLAASLTLNNTPGFNATRPLIQ